MRDAHGVTPRETKHPACQGLGPPVPPRYLGIGVGFSSGVIEEPGVASIGLAAPGVSLEAGAVVRIFLVPAAARELLAGCRLTHSSHPF